MAERRTPKSSAASPGFAVPEPSPAARELLRAFRQHESPSAREREQGLVALRARLELESSADAGPVPAANGRLYGIARATLVTVAVAAAVLLAIKAVGSGVTALADRARQPAMEAPYQGEAGSDGGQAVSRAPQILPPRRVDGEPTNASAEHGAGAIEPSAVEPAEPTGADRGERSREPASMVGARSPRPRSSSSSSSSSLASDADALEEELALIKRATEAKKAGRHGDGLAALREHAQRFPRGVLADERMVLKAELHCAAGRIGEADALVESFLRERAGSALAGRMRNVCRE